MNEDVLPLSRVRKIIKADPDVNLLSSDAVFVVTKAAELFLGKFTWMAYESASQENRKTILTRDLEKVSKNVDEFFFLEDLFN